jgi:shikimate 5-dehydrogenase
LSGERRDARPRVRLGVLGWPVAHSRSPAIQNAALAAAGLSDWRYQLLPAPPELFVEVVQALPAAGFRGVNVTIPHKLTALALATRPTDRASAIGAANTLVFESDHGVMADNTDAPALIAAVALELAGASALVLGAGGTARAAVWALNDAGAEVRRPQVVCGARRYAGQRRRPGRSARQLHLGGSGSGGLVRAAPAGGERADELRNRG